MSPSELYYYCEVIVPWPFENRDFVSHLTVRQDTSTKLITVDGPVVSGFVPVKEDIVRLANSAGKWLITPTENGTVKVVYTLHADPGGFIPAWLINLFAAEGPIESFQKLRVQLTKPAYAHVSLPFIKD